PIKLKRHTLGQTALIKLQLWTYHDHGTTGIVYTLAQKGAAVTSLLALEHIAERLKFTATASAEGLAALRIVYKAVYCFLQHALLIADDDIWRAKFEQPLQTLVAVNDAAIEIVQVRRCEASAIQLHHRAQIGWDDGKYG